MLKSGVDYLDGTWVTAFDQHEDGVRVRIKGKGNSREVECKYLVGADGGGSTVRKILDPAWGSDKTTVPVGVYQAYYKITDLGSLGVGHWNVFFEKEISNALCCMHKKGDQAVLCICGLKGQNLKSNMGLFKSFLQDRFQLKLGEFVRDEGCVIRFADLNYGKGRVLLAGESAGQMYLNGEGISAAIDGGFRAGRAIAHSDGKSPKAKIGEITMENDFLSKALGH